MQSPAQPASTMATHFKFYDKDDILSLTRIRRFETKLGERIQIINSKDHLEQSLRQTTARYILFGVPEDIGVKANYGLGGTDSVWVPFLSSFLNVQSNDFVSGEELLLLGHFDFGDIKYLIEQNAHGHEERIDAYRHAVNMIDEEVEKLAKYITSCGKIPIAIGGGHNNAYPLIKGTLPKVCTKQDCCHWRKSTRLIWMHIQIFVRRKEGIVATVFAMQKKMDTC